MTQMRAEAEMEGGGPPPGGTASHHQDNNPHPRDRAADDYQDTSEGGQGESAESDLFAYLYHTLGTAPGWLHVGLGYEPYITERGTYRHRRWVSRSFHWPEKAEEAMALILAESGRADVYVCPYLMACDQIIDGTKTKTGRTKGQSVARPLVHADIDRETFDEAKAEKLRDLGGFALDSGSPGHVHAYVPLTESVGLAPHEPLCRGLGAYIGGADPAKCSDNDVLRPPGTFNFKPTLDGAEPAPVRWRIEPLDEQPRADPRELAAVLGVDLDHPAPPPSGGAKANGGAKAKKSGERAKAEEFDLDKFPGVKAALSKDSGDRSADTYGVLAACYRAHLTFAQACWGVYQSPRLSERLDDRGEDHEIDLQRCWLRVVEDQQREEAAKNGGGTADPGRVLHLVRASDVTDDIPDWAWEWDNVGRIQIAVLTLFAGRPGTGKSTAGRWFAAQWSKGKLPGLWLGKPQTVAYIASEESLKYVVKPGLRAADADMNRIVFPEVKFNDKAVPLIAETDEARLTEQFLAQGVKVIIVDPVMATIERKVDIYRNNELRAALAPWVNIAAQINGIVIGIVHLTKGRNSDVVGAVNGSSAFGEVARCVFGFVKDPDNKKARVTSQVKNSCGPEDLSLAYEIRGETITTGSGRTGVVPLFVMGDESDISVEDILGRDGRNGMTDAQRRLLDFVNGRDETTPGDVIKAGLAKNHKLASNQLSRMHGRGWVGHPCYGVYVPLPKPRKEVRKFDPKSEDSSCT